MNIQGLRKFLFVFLLCLIAVQAFTQVGDLYKSNWNEDKWKGGLLNRDFTKKPAFDVLDRLINNEWKTNLTVNSATNEIKYNGFFGSYKIVVKAGGKTFEKVVNFPKKGSRNQIIILE